MQYIRYLPFYFETSHYRSLTLHKPQYKVLFVVLLQIPNYEVHILHAQRKPPLQCCLRSSCHLKERQLPANKITDLYKAISYSNMELQKHVLFKKITSTQACIIAQLFSSYFFEGISAVFILTGWTQHGMAFHCFVNRCQSCLTLMLDNWDSYCLPTQIAFSNPILLYASHFTACSYKLPCEMAHMPQENTV